VKSSELALTWLHPELRGLSATPLELAESHPGAATLLVRGAEVRAFPLAPRPDPGGIWLLPLRTPADPARALASVARDELAFRAAPPIPFFAGGSAPGERTTRLAPCWRGLLPGDAYPESVRGPARELVRALFPDRALLFRTLEHYALAGIDLAAQSERWREPPASSSRARVVAIEGIDGSGKSTHVAALREHLERRGLACQQLKIFRHGIFHDTVTELARRCAGERDLHLWRLERMIKAGDSLRYFHSEVAPALERCDVALFDRYVFTHDAAATGRLHHDPFTRELLSVYPAPERVYLLDLPAEAALTRIGTRNARTIDENPFMLERYRRRLLVLAERQGFVVLDARRAFDENQAAMRADLDRVLAVEREE
jgi:dTMP kinase